MLRTNRKVTVLVSLQPIAASQYEIPQKSTQSLKTEPRIKRENTIGYILCNVHVCVEMASRKRQTYQNEAKNLCTICV